MNKKIIENSTDTNIDEGKIILYTVEDIEDIFHLGRTKAYELMRSDGFPSFRINTKVYVERKNLINWIEMRKGKRYVF